MGYMQALSDPGNPAQALKLMTNDPRVAKVSAQLHARARRVWLHCDQP